MYFISAKESKQDELFARGCFPQLKSELCDYYQHAALVDVQSANIVNVIYPI